MNNDNPETAFDDNKIVELIKKREIQNQALKKVLKSLRGKDLKTDEPISDSPESIDFYDESNIDFLNNSEF